MSRIFYKKIKGISHINIDGSSRQELARTLKKGDMLILKADPGNLNDRWAVEVHHSKGGQLGFLPSDARDASSLLKGEPISARVHRLIGGTNWFSKIILQKKNLGVVIELEKGEPNWKRVEEYTQMASPIDKVVQEALNKEKEENIEVAIKQLNEAMKKVKEFTITNKIASAHKRLQAPINRLSLLLEKKKEYELAFLSIQEYYDFVDPVQPNKAEREAIRKRYDRLKRKLNVN